MNKLIRAYDVLEKIKTIEEEFIINEDAKLTNDVKEKIDLMDWKVLKEENTEKLKIQNISEDYNTNTAWYDINIKLMNDNKNITQHALENPRFGFIKKIINRLIMVSTRYQEIFNNSAVNLLGSSVQKIKELEKQNESYKNQINEMRQSQEYNKSIMFELTNEIKKSVNVINDLQNEIIALKNDHFFNDINDHIIQSDTKINLLEKKMQEMAESTNNHDRVDGLEKWMESISQQIKNDELWLSNTNKHIDEHEKWISTTNKRIDACNEMLSITPELGFQSFSQAGEDTIIMHILSKINNQIQTINYLDIGCNHYKNFNNTYRFYQKGLSGVLVEANPLLIDEIKKYRPRDIILNNGIGIEANQELDFYVINGGGLSSFNKNSVDKAIKNDPDAYIERIEKIKIITLNTIIEKYFNEAPTIVSIDIEGDEYSVLESLDEKKFRPLVFIVETIEYRKTLTLGTKRKDIINLMENKGYLEFAFTGVNSIFIDKYKVNLE